MATYGAYEVISYPDGYAVTDMRDHKIVFSTTSRATAHAKAKALASSKEAR